MTRHPIRSLAILLAFTACATAQVATTQPAPLAFPGAEGFGARATGGRGGQIVHVTTLDDAGPGSLRDAVSQPNRTVVFDVGGVIRVRSPVAFSDHLTVAGQTAPGGVAIFGGGISLSNRTNVIVRYLTIRSGIATPRGSKSLSVLDGSDIVLDHLSVGWGRWDNCGFTGHCTDITMQDCMIYEAIKDQQFAMLVDGARRMTFARNLFSNNHGRNPKGKGDLQFINNVIYNWGNQGFGGGHSGAAWHQDLIGNYLIAGPDSNQSFFNFANENDRVYSDGNAVDLDKDGALNGRAWTEADVTRPDPRGKKDAAGEAEATQPAVKLRESATPMPKAFNEPPVPVRIRSAQQAVADAIAGVGNTKYWDAVDARQIDDLRSFGTRGKTPADENEVGGMPPAPTTQPAPIDEDRDGMPDAWERESNLDPRDPTDANADADGDGYTNLEEFLNGTDPRRDDRVSK